MHHRTAILKRGTISNTHTDTLNFTFVSLMFVSPRLSGCGKNCIEVNDYVAVAFKIGAPYQRHTLVFTHGGVNSFE